MRCFSAGATLLVFSILFCGCACRGGPSAAEAGLKLLAVQYGRFVSQNKGMSPPGPQEFKDFIGQNSTLEDVDKIFISPRDQQPFVIVYNLRLGAPDKYGGPAIIYEQTGVAGKRLVALPTTRIEEVDEARWQELTAR